MAKILVNKHFDDKSKINREAIKYRGEIVVYDKAGSEGLYIVNSDDDVVNLIRPSSGASEGVNEDVLAEIEALKEAVEALKQKQLAEDSHIYLTESEYQELLANGSVMTEEGNVEYNEYQAYFIYESGSQGPVGPNAEFDQEDNAVVIGQVGIDKLQDGILDLSSIARLGDDGETLEFVGGTSSGGGAHVPNTVVSLDQSGELTLESPYITYNEAENAIVFAGASLDENNTLNIQ